MTPRRQFTRFGPFYMFRTHFWAGSAGEDQKQRTKLHPWRRFTAGFFTSEQRSCLHFFFFFRRPGAPNTTGASVTVHRRVHKSVVSRVRDTLSWQRTPPSVRRLLSKSVLSFDRKRNDVRAHRDGWSGAEPYGNPTAFDERSSPPKQFSEKPTQSLTCLSVTGGTSTGRARPEKCVLTVFIYV
jgi:hypothetical protein